MTGQKGTLLLKRSQVVVHWTDGSAETFPLVHEKTRVGRGKSGNEIAVPDLFQSVSRQHLEIRREKDGYRVIDLGSRNGTLVNGIYAKDIYLRNGDEIRIGQDDQGQQIRIEFQLGSESLVDELEADPQAVTLPPSAGLAGKSPVNKPYLKVRWQNGRTNYFPLEKDRVVIGRGPEADLRVPANLRFVSGQQFEVERKEVGFFLRDLNSANGTHLNNRLLDPQAHYPLGNGAIVRIGDDNLGVSVSFTFQNPGEGGEAARGFIQAAQATQLSQKQMILVGRLENCDVVLDSPQVSRRHALLRQRGETWTIEDLDSSNGTYVNDERVRQAELREGDLIQISTFRLLFQGGVLVPYQSAGLRLDARNLTVYAKRGAAARLLDRIDLSVLPREFMAVVGGSDDERSALLAALTGARRASGEVMLNGRDFYGEYDEFRGQIGYVPRADILPPSLTVEQALDYAARLRLPSNLSPDERQHRIDAVLDTLALNSAELRKTRIADLRGAGRKRANIAAELLADPKLIYLDEAAEGLDPAQSKRLMHTLRRIADEGRTVVLVTRAGDGLAQTDLAAFLADGKLAYFGPPEEALKFFEVEDFADIHERLDAKGGEWRQVFEAEKPESHKKYLLARQSNLHSAPKHARAGFQPGLADFLPRLRALVERSLSLLPGDRLRLFALLAFLPLAGLVQLAFSQAHILSGDPALLADPSASADALFASYIAHPKASLFIFLMGLAAALTGLFLSANDLVVERSVFSRERASNLGLLPYLSARALFYGLFGAIQVGLYLFILSLGVEFPAGTALDLFLTIYLTLMAGVALGLLISAVSNSSVTALRLATAALLFQILFSGTLFDLRGRVIEPLSYLSLTRWSQTALGATIGIERLAEGTILCNTADAPSQAACFPFPSAKTDLTLDYDKSQLPRAWMALTGLALLSLTLTGLRLRRVRPA